jgi:hypothetical protein
MNRSALSLLLALSVFALAAIPSAAQTNLPRTISLQGRARDASNVYLTGTRTVSIAMYNVATGGTPMWSEQQTVTFTNGVFTLSIGSTGGGLPDWIPFDEEYWVGLTIQNFNSGLEILPRLRCQTVPYAVRSQYADTAAAFAIPAIIDVQKSGAAVVINNTQETALIANGGEYAIISQGPDSSDHYFVSGGEAGNSAPAPGAIYRDNAPMAWGLIGSRGEMISSFGIESVTHTPNSGTYTVLLSNPAAYATYASVRVPSLAPIVQPSIITDIAVPVLAYSWFFLPQGSPNYDRTVMVYVRNAQGAQVDSGFSIIVFGRPK